MGTKLRVGGGGWANEIGKGANNFDASLRGATNFGAPIVLDSLGVNKYANKKLGENKVICESYSDYRYF